jgi:Ca2+-binding RTX toxin-like protein
MDGAGNEDPVSTSSAAMKMTLRGGVASDVLIGGPGDDVLDGGEDFDDVEGRGGDDTAALGADFDRFTWNPGDGNDVVDGGPSHDSIPSTAATRPSSCRSRQMGGASGSRATSTPRSPISAASRS